MPRNRFGSAALLGTAALTALVTATACTATDSAAPGGRPRATTPVFSPVPSGSAAPTQHLMFPGTDFPAAIQGYDDATQMVTFQVRKWVPGGADDGHYDADPAKPGVHRLPLATQVTVTSLSTMCAGVAPSADPTKPSTCTRQQLITGLRDGHGALAQVRVDSTDHIESVKELYTP